jgi:hypothetical protein
VVVAAVAVDAVAPVMASVNLIAMLAELVATNP